MLSAPLTEFAKRGEQKVKVVRIYMAARWCLSVCGMKSVGGARAGPAENLMRVVCLQGVGTNDM